jgi:hypothetical protein
MGQVEFEVRSERTVIRVAVWRPNAFVAWQAVGYEESAE